MTYQPPPPPQQGGQPQYGAPPTPPPPPAPGPQHGYGVPPQQGYGAPPPAPGYGGYSQPRPGFNAAAVNPFDWAILGAALLAFIFSFLSYYTATVSYSGVSASGHENAWHGFFGWFAVLLALVAGGVLLVSLVAPHVALPSPRLITLCALALALILVIIAAFVTPDAPSVTGVSYGRGIGYWLDLILIVIGTGLAGLRFQQHGGNLASPFAGVGGRPTAAPYAGAQMPPPPPGYGPPPAAPGIPPAPPPGYGPPSAPQQSGFGQTPPPPPGYGPTTSSVPPEANPPSYGQTPPPPPGYGPPQG